jgi:hypothetical protein
VQGPDQVLGQDPAESAEGVRQRTTLGCTHRCCARAASANFV